MAIFNEFRGVFSKPNNGIIQLIAINGIIFLLVGLISVFASLMGNNIVGASLISWLSIPADLEKLLFRPWTIITYMFLHQRFFHILFNMLWLFWIGQILVEYLGNRRIWVLYLFGGISGSIIYLIAYNIFPLFANSIRTSYALGASAGVLSVVVGTATLLPDYGIRLLLLGNVKLKYLALALIILDFLSLAGTNAGGHFAHLGGALFGFIFIKQLQNGNDLGKPIYKLGNWISEKRQAKSPLKMAYKGNQKTKSEISQAEIDAILDKIAEKGYEGLTAAEKSKLFKASNNNNY